MNTENAILNYELPKRRVRRIAALVLSTLFVTHFAIGIGLHALGLGILVNADAPSSSLLKYLLHALPCILLLAFSCVAVMLVMRSRLIIASWTLSLIFLISIAAFWIEVFVVSSPSMSTFAPLGSGGDQYFTWWWY